MTVDEGIRLVTRLVGDFARAGLRPPFIQSTETPTTIEYVDVYVMQTGLHVARLYCEADYDALLESVRKVYGGTTRGIA